MRSLVRSLMAVVVVANAVGACGGDDDGVDPATSGAGGALSSGGSKSDGGTGDATGATAGKSTGGNAPGGSSAAGQSSAGTDSEGGAPEQLGGAGGEETQGGAGGEPALEPPPFSGPYAAVYAAPIEGVDTRFPKQADFRAGGLVHWVSQLDEDHDMGTAKNLDVAIDGVVQWGRWADGKLAGNDGFSVNALQGFHYAIGAISASLPATGTQSYVMVGATPVTTGDGSIAVGTATATATATFGAPTAVGVSIDLNIDGVSYTVTSTGGTATPATSEVTAWDAAHPARVGGVPPKPKTGICADGCNLSVQGFFAGASAAQLALVVHVFDGNGGSPTSLSSVVVLKKQQ